MEIGMGSDGGREKMIMEKGVYRKGVALGINAGAGEGKEGGRTG